MTKAIVTTLALGMLSYGANAQTDLEAPAVEETTTSPDRAVSPDEVIEETDLPDMDMEGMDEVEDATLLDETAPLEEGFEAGEEATEDTDDMIAPEESIMTDEAPDADESALEFGEVEEAATEIGAETEEVATDVAEGAEEAGEEVYEESTEAIDAAGDEVEEGVEEAEEVVTPDNR